MPIPLDALFSVTYGNKFDMNKMAALPKREGGVNFVGRSSRHHGVSGTIAPLQNVAPYPAGCITVALGGSYLLSSFVQLDPFYTAQNVAVLQSSELSMSEKIFTCMCIRHNRPRYSAFGREANRTIRTLLVPSREEFPQWLTAADITSIEHDYEASDLPSAIAPAFVSWKSFRLSDLFDIVKGKRLTQANMTSGDTPFIASTEFDNGRRESVGAAPMHPRGCITITYNGSIGEAFYQPEPFFASDDVNVLYPKFELDDFTALFICTVIRKERFRYSYGRKWNLDRMNLSEIKLPATPDGDPDFRDNEEVHARIAVLRAPVYGNRSSDSVLSRHTCPASVRSPSTTRAARILRIAHPTRRITSVSNRRSCQSLVSVVLRPPISRAADIGGSKSMEGFDICRLQSISMCWRMGPT